MDRKSRLPWPVAHGLDCPRPVNGKVAGYVQGATGPCFSLTWTDISLPAFPLKSIFVPLGADKTITLWAHHRLVTAAAESSSGTWHLEPRPPTQRLLDFGVGARQRLPTLGASGVPLGDTGAPALSLQGHFPAILGGHQSSFG